MSSQTVLSFNRKFICTTIVTATLLTACGEKSSSTSGSGFNNDKDTDTDFDQTALVTSIVDNVITPTYQNFSEQSAMQMEAINSYCQAEISLSEGGVEQAEVTSLKDIAKDSWRNAIDAWQLADMMQLPPLLADDGALRNNIYSWPITNSCGVDLDVTYFKADDINGQPYDIAKRSASRKSMVGLEYLLFNDNLEHSCTGSTIPVDWNAQTEQYRKIARCEYALEVAKDIETNTDELLVQWLGENDNAGYAAKLKQAGEADSDFDSVHDAVNEISDAIFYLDSVTKDEKLATPLGLFSNECGTQACPESVESTYSKYSINNIENNLLALKMFLQGALTDNQAEALGFTDYLNDVGDTLTAEFLTEQVEVAINDAQNYPNSLADTLVSDEEKVTATHAEVKAITDSLKSDFINSLALELPQTSAGDND